GGPGPGRAGGPGEPTPYKGGRRRPAAAADLDRRTAAPADMDMRIDGGAPPGIQPAPAAVISSETAPRARRRGPAPRPGPWGPATASRVLCVAGRARPRPPDRRGGPALRPPGSGRQAACGGPPRATGRARE